MPLMTDQQLAAELFSFTFAIVYADCVVTSGVGEALAGSCVAAGVGEAEGLADSCAAAGVGLIVGAAPRTTSPCTSRSPTATVIAALARDVITKE